VSNHGGRQLDYAPAAIDMLPAICAAVAGRAEVWVDGGVRRGTDVLKALALGARGVLLGRPALYGLALGGQQGVERVISTLGREFEMALALAGCASLADVSPRLLLGPGRRGPGCCRSGCSGGGCGGGRCGGGGCGGGRCGGGGCGGGGCGGGGCGGGGCGGGSGSGSCCSAGEAAGAQRRARL
jgi:hypothetical protein